MKKFILMMVLAAFSSVALAANDAPAGSGQQNSGDVQSVDCSAASADGARTPGDRPTAAPSAAPAAAPAVSNEG